VSIGAKAELTVLSSWKHVVESSDPVISAVLSVDAPPEQFWQLHLYRALFDVTNKPGAELLGGNEFIPLWNFQSNDRDFHNTCFIAAVINLRILIPAISCVLGLQNRTWNDTIKLVRAKWNSKYSYAVSHGGQGDMAELLDDILHEATGFGFFHSEQPVSGLVITLGRGLRAGNPFFVCTYPMPSKVHYLQLPS